LRAAPGGNRIMLLPFAGGALVYWYVTQQRRPGPLLLVCVLATALTGSAVLLAIRDAATRQETGVRGAVAAVLSDPAKILAPLTRGGDTEMAPALAAVMSAIPTEIPRTWGMAVFGDLVIRPIPRALWHDKPLAPREQVIATMWPAEYNTEGMKLANPEFSILLYFYLDFGLPGIAVGMALFGLGARVAYEYFCRFGSPSTWRRLRREAAERPPSHGDSRESPNGHDPVPRPPPLSLRHPPRGLQRAAESGAAAQGRARRARVGHG